MISLEQLTKVYETGSHRTTVLDRVDFRVDTGEIAAVVGPSGAGKSTLAQCVTLLERPTSGSVVVNGDDLTRLGDRLEPRGEVRRVPDGGKAALLGRPDVSDDRRSRVDPDAESRETGLALGKLLGSLSVSLLLSLVYMVVALIAASYWGYGGALPVSIAVWFVIYLILAIMMFGAAFMAIGAACDFLTPIGHQCNTLVMGPGGYRFGDYWRLGLPLSFIVVIVGVPLIAIFWPYHP